MEAHQIIINNQLISYVGTQSTGEKCLLFLHGWGSNKEVWGQVSKLISQSVNQQYTIYALDLPGFGQSPLSLKQQLQAGLSVGDYAEIVKGFIEKLALKNIIIVGHSFGGRVGIKLASQYPDIISQLVLVDSAGFVTPASKKNLMGVVAKIIKPIFKPRFMQGLRKKIYKGLGAEDYLTFPELKATFLKVVNEDLSKDMKGIKIPTLIITGENDKDTPIAFGKRMNFLIPNSQLLILKNAGHYSFLDQPEEFVKILAKFI
jgi:pimeloyl-ACP methyl ester carboxylesterase